MNKVRLKVREYRVLVALATLIAASILILGLVAVQPAQASFPGANGKIVFESNRPTQNPEGDSELFAMNPDGSGVTNLTTNNTPEVAPAWSADGRQIAFVCWDPKTLSAEICKMNADGSSRIQLTNDQTSSVYYPAWSPNGTKIAFSNFAHGYIYVMNADGTRQTQLAFGDDPNWSPDGKQIVFASAMDGRGALDIYKMNADGSGITQLTNSTVGADTAPNWSPDGREIVFQSSRDGNDHIYKMNADGSGQTRLTNNPLNPWFSGIYDGSPAWSPDGTKIVFQANRKMSNGMFQNYEVYVMNADGSGQTNLTNTADGIFDRTPDWQPVDNSGPAPVGSFAASAGDREVSLSWTNPTDADFEATRILRSTSGFATGPEPTSEQVQVYEGASTSHSDTGLTNGTVYYYTAFARDRAGNWSKSATASARPVTSDASPPTTTATPSPEPDETGWNKDDVTVTLKATDDEGGSGLKEITYSATGAQQIASTPVPGSSASVLITTEGETTISYFAKDNADNAEDQKTFTVKLDKTAPTVSSVTPPDAATGVARSTDVAATFSSEGAPMDQATLNTSTVELVKEGTTPVDAGVSCDDPCRTVTLNPDVDQLDENAIYTATLKGGSDGAKDAAGNALAEDKAWSFTTADTTAPTVTLTAPQQDGAAVGGTSVIFSAEATDNVGVERVEFLVGGGVVGTDATAENGDSYSVGWDSTSVGDGSILLQVRAYDTSGQAATFSRTVVVDNAAPTGSVLINGGARSTKKSTVQLTLSATDNEGGSDVGYMRFSNDGTNWSGWEPYATTKSWVLARGKGTRTVYAEFRDEADNVSERALDTIRRR